MIFTGPDLDFIADCDDTWFLHVAILSLFFGIPTLFWLRSVRFETSVSFGEKVMSISKESYEVEDVIEVEPLFWFLRHG